MKKRTVKPSPRPLLQTTESRLAETFLLSLRFLRTIYNTSK